MSTNYEFKKIGDVDVIESVNDSAHVIIEDAGILKKMAAKNIGAVKSVNGVIPDESGNVVVEVPKAVTSWNDLTDRPFYEESSEVTMLDNVVMDCTSSTRYSIADLPYGFNEGNTYTVTVNGTEYSCVAYMINEAGLMIPAIGNGTLAGLTGGNGEPFVAAMAMGEFTMWFAEPGTYTVTIRETSIIHKIDEKFIPDIDWSDIGVNYNTITWDGSTNDREFFEMPFIENTTMKLYKVSDVYIPGEQFVDGIMKVSGAEVFGLPPEFEIVSDMIDEVDGYAMIGSALPLIVSISADYIAANKDNSIVANNPNISEGTYILLAESSVIQQLFNVEIANNIFATELKLIAQLKPIPDLLIPENIARVDDIPNAIVNPSTATVGQTLVVKAVDENGKPTEWECVDAGVSSWNGLTDKPFYEESSEVTILDNVVIDCSSLPHYEIADFPYEFTEGNTYTVTVNGTEYSCVAYALTAPDGSTTQVIGNATLVDMTGGNNEPFFFDVLENYLYAAFSATGTYTVTITTIANNVHKIDSKFVPSECFIVHLSVNNGKLSADKTYAEISEASVSGKVISLEWSVDGEYYSYQLTFVNAGFAVFSSACASDVGIDIEIVAISSDNEVQFDHKSIKSATAVADVTGETVTAAEFNALLAALRSAGLMAT